LRDKDQKAFEGKLTELQKNLDEQYKKAAETQREMQHKHELALANMTAQINASRSSGGCFPSNAMCRLESGKLCKISELKEGQRVCSVDDKNNIIFSEVYFVDGDNINCSMRQIYYLKDDKEFHISATSDHLIYISQEENLLSLEEDNPVITSSIKIGDFIFVLDNDKNCLVPRKVIRITKDQEFGKYYAFTLQHRLIVDDVLASSYEINQVWGKADTAIMRFLYQQVSPTFISSPANKLFCRAYDNIFEPIALGIRDYISNLSM